MPYHNQSSWGFAMNDAWMITEDKSRQHIETQPETYSIFDMLPDHAMYVTARMVLNPSFGKEFRDNTQIDNVDYLQENGSMGKNLIVTIGHDDVIKNLGIEPLIYFYRRMKISKSFLLSGITPSTAPRILNMSTANWPKR
ncbi:MAG: hypothetical protein U5J63_16795 [Fodinibius sp.]|nr:hypothetical protein [Fodinibius sp.]